MKNKSDKQTKRANERAHIIFMHTIVVTRLSLTFLFFLLFFSFMAKKNFLSFLSSELMVGAVATRRQRIVFVGCHMHIYIMRIRTPLKNEQNAIFSCLSHENLNIHIFFLIYKKEYHIDGIYLRYCVE